MATAGGNENQSFEAAGQDKDHFHLTVLGGFSVLR